MEYDLIVIGGGPGGYTSAIRAAQLGKMVALVEKAELGGTCLNRGCIPTKALMHSADLYHEMASAEKFGISVEGKAISFTGMHARKTQVVEQLRNGVATLLKANGVTVIEGEARFKDAKTIQVGTEEYTAVNYLIAAGSVPAIPPIPGIDLPNVVTSDDMLDTDKCDYRELVIIGGGVIGVEMASIYAAIGTKVTIIEALDRIVANMDREISQNLNMILKKRGITINTGASVTKIEQADGKLVCSFARKGVEEQVAADGVLVCVGRRAASAALNCEAAGIELERGRIMVDANYMTSTESIYAVGDVIGGIQLAHAAEAQGIATVELIFGEAPTVDPSLIPGCVYTSPEIASVGITADDAKQQGIAVTVGKYIMTSNGKSLIEDQERGFIKLVFDTATGKLLGAQMMCGRATDLIGEMVTAISVGLTRSQLEKAVHPHPTFCEGISEAIHAADGTGIHTMPQRKRV